MEGMIMSWHYEFYKVYKTKPEDADLWRGRSTDDLPDYLQFFQVNLNIADSKAKWKRFKSISIRLR